jgi:hypothetical protein
MTISMKPRATFLYRRHTRTRLPTSPIPIANSQPPTAGCANPADYQLHCRRFFDEYQPATPTESQLTQELADTAWRLNRIPSLEAELLDRAANPPSEHARIHFDIVDAHGALATLGLHSERLSRQFQKALDQLREIQSERRHDQERRLKDAAALLELHKHKGIPYNPAEVFSENGFVFSKAHTARRAQPGQPGTVSPGAPFRASFSTDQVEAYARRLKLLNESRHIEHVLFHMAPARAAIQLEVPPPRGSHAIAPAASR